jgi:hypothetical protein
MCSERRKRLIFRMMLCVMLYFAAVGFLVLYQGEKPALTRVTNSTMALGVAVALVWLSKTKYQGQERKRVRRAAVTLLAVVVIMVLLDLVLSFLGSGFLARA